MDSRGARVEKGSQVGSYRPHERHWAAIGAQVCPKDNGATSRIPKPCRSTESHEASPPDLPSENPLDGDQESLYSTTKVWEALTWVICDALLSCEEPGPYE